MRKQQYTVENSRNAIYTRTFTSRRQAEQYIARLRRLYPAIKREGSTFTISRTLEEQ